MDSFRNNSVTKTVVCTIFSLICEFASFYCRIDMAEPANVARWRCIAIILGLVCFILIITIVVVTVLKDDAIRKATSPSCRGGNSVIDVSEAKYPSIFDDLTTTELKGIQEYMYQIKDLKLVKPNKSTMNSSNIYTYDYFLPKKTDVLNYLDRNGKKPDRQARLVIFRGDLNPAVVEEYIVGPLPHPTYHKLLVSSARKNPVPYAHRPFSGLENFSTFDNIFVPLDKEIGYILMESYGATFSNCGDKCLVIFPASLSSAIQNKDVRRFWYSTMQLVEYYTLHPIDFAVLVNAENPDPSKYFIEKIVYAGNEYASVSVLKMAYNSNSVNKTRVKFPEYSEYLFSTMNRRGKPVPDQPQRPPKSVEPDGKRYSIHHRHVEYLQWSFDFRMSMLTGPQIYDVRFGGERIAYEISLQELAVYYSGYKASPRAPDYIDSGELIGLYAQALVPGADCPESATFISTRHVGESSLDVITQHKSFCLFEQDTGIPLKRHLSYLVEEGGYYTGLSDIVLILRTILSIYNYDYIIDFVFHQNGALEVRSLSTGYIYSTLYAGKTLPYGFRLQENLVGNIHHHLFHWKADLDILGTSNRYETLDISTENVNNEVNSGIVGETYAQILFNRNLKETELQAAYKFNFDRPRYHIIHNNKHQTKFGAPRAYR